MAEERIAERIDANLMNVSMEDLQDLPKKMFTDKMTKITKKTTGKLIVKEYPTACLLYTSPSPRDKRQSRMPSSA